MVDMDMKGGSHGLFEGATDLERMRKVLKISSEGIQ